MTVRATQGVAWAVGRVLMSSIFLESVIVKLIDWPGGLAELQAGRLPANSLLLACVVAAQFAGGAAVAIGLLTRWAACGLIAFLVPATFAYHAFWSAPAGHMEHELVGFFQNIALMGAFVLLAAVGPGPVSVDELLRRMKA